MKKMSYVVGVLCLAAAVVYAAGTGTIILPKTGVTSGYTTGDDGYLRKGVAWPTPRFIDSANGTVTDMLTGLVWLKKADCYPAQTWNSAINSASALASGACGLNDGSSAGMWRLPNVKELQSLIDLSKSHPALATNPFVNIYSASTDLAYWTSSSFAGLDFYAYNVDMYLGGVGGNGMFNDGYVWPVRGGQ